MLRLAAVALVLLAAVPAQAFGPSFLKVGMTYSQARYLLIRHGYTPVTHDDDVASRCNTAATVCQTYPEAQGCQGVETLACDFRFYGATGYLKVSAGGLQVDQLSVTALGPL